jgi:TatD DNase family protein
LVVETDAPYLAPHPHRGKRNEPAFMVLVAERLAQLCSLSLNELSRQVTENTVRLFRLPAAN